MLILYLHNTMIVSTNYYILIPNGLIVRAVHNIYIKYNYCHSFVSHRNESIVPLVHILLLSYNYNNIYYCYLIFYNAFAGIFDDTTVERRCRLRHRNRKSVAGVTTCGIY